MERNQFLPAGKQPDEQDARSSTPGLANQRDMEPKLLSMEERIRRIPISRRRLMDKGTPSVQVWRQLAPHLQEPGTAVQHQWSYDVQLERLLRRFVHQLCSWICLDLQPA